jgi:hypothetical protein
VVLVFFVAIKSTLGEHGLPLFGVNNCSSSAIFNPHLSVQSVDHKSLFSRTVFCGSCVFVAIKNALGEHGLPLFRVNNCYSSAIFNPRLSVQSVDHIARFGRSVFYSSAVFVALRGIIPFPVDEGIEPATPS